MLKHILPATLLLLAATPALAGGKMFPPTADPVVKKECGACHMAYQPQLLPRKSWEAMMDRLSDHFGENASLDDKTRDAIKAYLTANAGDGGKWLRGVNTANPPQRISEMPRFKKEHGEGKVQRMKEKSGVKTWADCVACHKQADRGYYEDD
ncbi:MAG: diheme cytochrome c [Magnetospirillum sp. WYHS-4]